MAIYNQLTHLPFKGLLMLNNIWATLVVHSAAV